MENFIKCIDVCLAYKKVCEKFALAFMTCSVFFHN